jgi:hypothetical protein
MSAPRVTLRTRPQALFSYSGRSLLVTDLHGGVTGNEMEGFWFENTRLLSRFELRSDGQPVQGFSAAPVDRRGHLTYVRLPPGPNVPEQGAYLEVAHFLDEGLRTRIRLLNHSTQPVSVSWCCTWTRTSPTPRRSTRGNASSRRRWTGRCRVGATPACATGIPSSTGRCS